jgi:type IV secretion system pilin
MKRLILIISLMVGVLAPSVALSGQSLAVSVVDCSGSLQTTTVCQDVTSQQSSGQNPIIHIIKIAIEIISYIIGALAIIFILVGAIRMITSGGDAQAAASARSSFTYALIGIVIAVLAQVIVEFVLDKVK